MHDDAEYGSAQEESKDQVVARLAKLSPIEFGQVKKLEAQALGCNVGELEREVKAWRKKQFSAPTEAEQWPEPVDGDALLDDVCRAFRGYIVISERDLNVLALWAVHTHAYACWDHTPRLHVRSPKRRSGKSRVLEVLACVVARPLIADDLTAAVVFRLTEDHHPTLLIDEIDQWLDPQGELIGILNAGHTRGRKALRCIGDEHSVREFDVFTPLAMAGIGRIKSDTLADRAIPVLIRRRLKSEPIKRFRRRYATDLTDLHRQIARWAADHSDALASQEPEIPETIDNDRLVDCWIPLLAIADIAGGEWPARARQIMVAQHASAEVDEDEGWDLLLLADLKAIFEETGEERLFSKEILIELHLMEERPWPEYPNRRGAAKPITERQMARLLAPHEIKPKLLRKPSVAKPGRGYERHWFEDTWKRYLTDPQNDGLSVTPLQPAENCGAERYDQGDSPSFVTDAHPLHRPTCNTTVTRKAAESATCNGVTDKTPSERVEDEGPIPGFTDEDQEAEDEERRAIMYEPPPDHSFNPPWQLRGRSGLGLVSSTS